MQLTIFDIDPQNATKKYLRYYRDEQTNLEITTTAVVNTGQPRAE